MYRVCCAAEDTEGNRMQTASCSVVDPLDASPPVLNDVDVSCSSPTSATLTMAVSKPATISFALVEDSLALPGAADVPADSLFSGALPAALASAFVEAGTVEYEKSTEQGVIASAAFCSLDSAGSFVLFVAARGRLAAQSFSDVLAVPFDMPTLCGNPAAFECTPSTFLDQLQPRLTPTSGAGLLTGRPVVSRTADGLKVSQARFCYCSVNANAAASLHVRDGCLLDDTGLSWRMTPVHK